MSRVRCTVTTCQNIVNGYCNLAEVELVWMAAMDFGGAIGPRVFLRCTDLKLPEKEKKDG